MRGQFGFLRSWLRTTALDQRPCTGSSAHAFPSTSFRSEPQLVPACAKDRRALLSSVLCQNFHPGPGTCLLPYYRATIVSQSLLAAVRLVTIPCYHLLLLELIYIRGMPSITQQTVQEYEANFSETSIQTSKERAHLWSRRLTHRYWLC